MNKPILSIQCLVYNHGAFLHDCLEGFVMQKTNFKFEAIVHDDASTDNSANIIRGYAEKYPDIIKPIYQEENLYQTNKGKIRNIMNEALTGRYISICEGDDYWTDPYKLQKQVDFLEANPDYTMCFHNTIKVGDPNINPNFKFGMIKDRDYIGDEFLRYWMVPTASVVFRREVLEFQDKSLIGFERCVYGDIGLFLSCAELGKVRGLSDTMSAYRVTASSVTNCSNMAKFYNANIPHHYEFIRENFKKINPSLTRRCVGTAYIQRFRLADKRFSKRWFKDLCKGLWLNPSLILEKILGRELK